MKHMSYSASCPLDARSMNTPGRGDAIGQALMIKNISLTAFFLISLFFASGCQGAVFGTVAAPNASSRGVHSTPTRTEVNSELRRDVVSPGETTLPFPSVTAGTIEPSFPTSAATSLVATPTTASTGTSTVAPSNQLVITTIDDWRTTIRQIESADPGTAQARADALWQMLTSSQRVPLLFGVQVVFLYKGKASSVTVRGDFTQWAEGRGLDAERVGQTDLWVAQTTLPVDSRTEYRFVLDEQNWVSDPVNPYISRNGVNSVLVMPQFQASDLTEPRAGIERGVLTDDTPFKSDSMGYTINYRVYLPPEYAALDKLPVLYVTDGEQFADEQRGAMPIVMDNLIAEGRIKPALAVFLDAREPFNLTNNRRNLEFLARGEDYARFITQELIPLIDKTYKSDPSPDARVIVGTSLGGLLATFAAARYPDMFHQLAAFSPAYWPLGNPGATGDPQQAQGVMQMSPVIDRLLQCGDNTGIQCPPLPLKIFMSSGIPSWDMGDLPGLATDLDTMRYPILFAQSHQGHSWSAWSVLMDEMLLYFLAK